MNAHDVLDTLAVLGVLLLMALPSLLGHAHDRRIDRQLRRAEQGLVQDQDHGRDQNSSSKETEPSTATWYADGRRSKKLVSS
ncbi:hypothetical protein [Streptomyces sp. NPDC059063]|uniref:hypothetical protein n=1 Tax=unclassified Streptomyces TaxID=2593676 RepID=UPI00369206B8